MAYGVRMYEERELEFPSLLDGEQVDALFEPPEEDKVPKFQPIKIVRKYSVPLADELHRLWGYPGFCKYIEAITDPRRLKGVVLPADLLKALLALSTYHDRNSGQLDGIDVELPDTAAVSIARRAAA